MKFLTSITLSLLLSLSTAYSQESNFETTKLLAEQGDADAQFNLGVMYAYGVGVPQDFLPAYVWFSAAAAQGLENARTYRDRAAGLLTHEQRARGQEMATRCFESGYKDCD